MRFMKVVDKPRELDRDAPLRPREVSTILSPFAQDT